MGSKLLMTVDSGLSKEFIYNPDGGYPLAISTQDNGKTMQLYGECGRSEK